MSNQSMLTPGDVVFGAFATKDGKVLNHYSIVLKANAEGCVLVYTTSLKDVTFQGPQRFSAEDVQLGLLPATPGRWDATTICVVPTSRVRKTGRISSKTFAKIKAAYARASDSASLEVVMLTPKNEVVFA